MNMKEENLCRANNEIKSNFLIYRVENLVKTKFDFKVG